jgi:hypothetical protein
MAFCPNKSLPEWQALEKAQPKKAYYLWNKYEGNVPKKFYNESSIEEFATIEEEKATQYLNKLFPGQEVLFYDFAKQIGNKTMHGYVSNAGINLWRQAEVGTEYHEAYHLLFRTMLSNSQREFLYKDAEKQFGKPTTEEVEAIQKQYPDSGINTEEAYYLALEEKMAEGFREYKLTESTNGLLDSIAKWFKDLFTWLKAIITNDIGLRQMYSLMSSTKVNQSLFGRNVLRNPEIMHSSINPERSVEGIPNVVEDAIVDGISNMFVDEVKNWENPDIKLILGDANSKGSIVNGLHYGIYAFKDNRGQTKENTTLLINAFKLEQAYNKSFKGLKKAEKEKNAKKIAEFTKQKNEAVKAFTEFRNKHGIILKAYPAITESMNQKQKNEAMAERIRRGYIIHVIENWNGKLDNPITKNVIIPSWKEKVIKNLSLYGYKFKGSKISIVEDETITTDEAELAVMEDSGAEKLHEVSHFTISPYKRMSDKVKLLLRRIPVTEVGENGKIKNVNNMVFTNKVKYHDPVFVYKQLSELWANVGTFDEMEARLSTFAAYRPDYKSIKRAISNMSLSKKAMLFNAFNNSITESVIIMTGKDSKIISSNSKTVQRTSIKRWRSQAIEIEGQEYDNSVNNRALYVKNTDETSEISTFKLKVGKFNEIKKLFAEVYDYANTPVESGFITQENVISKPAQALGMLLWNLGINIGSNTDVTETLLNVQTLLNKGYQVQQKSGKTLKTGRELYKAIYDNASLYAIVNSMAPITIVKRKAIVGEQRTVITPYFDLQKSGLNFLAEIVPLFQDKVAESYVQMDGTKRFNINQNTALDDLVQAFKKDPVKAFEIYKSDPFFYNPVTGHSHLFNHLINNPKFLQKFQAKDVEGIKKNEDGKMYEDYNKLDYFIQRLNLFVNNGDKEVYFAPIPTQADRGRSIAVAIPRLTGHSDIKFNTENRLVQHEILRKQIIEDLIRMNHAKNVNSSKTLIDGYHTGPQRALDNKYMQLTVIDPKTNELIVQNKTIKENGVPRDMADEVYNYLEADKKNLTPLLQNFENELTSMISKLLDFYDTRAESYATRLKESSRINEIDPSYIDIWSPTKRTADNEMISDAQRLKNLIKDFLIHEDLGRNEVIKLTRGNRALYKNNENFTKRMKLLTTPGNKLAIKGTIRRRTPEGKLVTTESWRPDEDYGMLPYFNDFTFADLQGDLTQGIFDQISGWVTNTINELRELGYTDEQIEFVTGYNPKKFDESDGLAVINEFMYRALLEGDGKWEEWHERGFQNYLQTGEFVYVDGPLPPNAKVGEAIPILPFKPFFENRMNVNNTVVVETQKTAYFPLFKSYTKTFPVLDDVRQRMSLVNVGNENNPYVGLGLTPIHVAHAASAKKTYKGNIYDLRSKVQNGKYIPGQLTDIVFQINDSTQLRFPQIVPGEKDIEETIANRQLKKNGIANIVKDAEYFYNAGLTFETKVTGKEVEDLYHAAIEELIIRDLESVNKELGFTAFKKVVNKLIKENGIDGISNVEEFKQAKLTLLQNLRDIIEKQAVERDLIDTFIDALHITIDETTGIPKFTIPMDFPVYGKKFQTAIFSIFNNNVFKQKIRGTEAVQTQTLGGFETDTSLKFLEITNHTSNSKGKRLAHAEIMIKPSAMAKLGLKIGETLSIDDLPEEMRRIVGYRIPNQDKASMIIFKIKGFLPEGNQKSILVPPQLVKLMGSDFDVDKMFLLFPEFNKGKDGKISKVVPNYAELSKDPSKVKSVEYKELKTIMLDTYEAVLSSPEHFLETLAPLDNKALPMLRNKLIDLIPTLALSDTWIGGEYEENSMARNMLGNKLRGLWANALAGRNVAINMELNVFDSYAIKIQGEPINTKFLSNTKTFANIVDDEGKPIAHFDSNVYTDKIISRYLSAAVDASNDPFQYVINDNMTTFPVELMWINFYGDTELLHYFLQSPIIRDFVDTLDDKYNNSPLKINDAYNTVMKKYDLEPGLDLPSNYKQIDKTVAMSREDIMGIQVRPDIALINFMKLFSGGKQLQEIFKVITPDTMDGLNRLESMEAYMDRKEAFSNPIDGKFRNMPLAFYGRSFDENPVDQILEENSVYGLERGYYNMILGTLDAAAIAFPMQRSEEFIKFKQAIKDMTGRTSLTSEQHRDINAHIIFTLLTREESPLNIYFNKSYSEQLYVPAKNRFTLFKRMEMLKAKVPSLEANEFLSKIEEDPEIKERGIKNFVSPRFDNSQAYTINEKQRIRRDLANLIYKPEAYLAKAKKNATPEEKKKRTELINEIKQLGFDFIMHNFIVNGFKPSSTNYMELIPTEFFTSPLERISQELPPISVAEYMHEQAAKIQNKGYFTNKDLLQFFRIFGEIRPGGFNLADRKNFDNKKVLKEVLVEPSYPGADHPMIKVFRSDKETGIYLLDTTAKTSNKNKVTYVSLRKTSNNNKHLVGGEFLNIKKIPGNYNMEELLDVLQTVLDNTKYTDSPDSVYQLCML